MKTSVEGSTNPWGLDLTLSAQNLTVTVAGESKTVKLPVIGVANGTATTATLSADGKITVSHANVGTAGTYGPSADSDSTINVAEITTNAQGHVSAVTNRTATLNRVKRTASSGSGALLFAPSSAGTGEVNFNTAIAVSGGNLSATTFTEGGTLLSAKYADLAHKSVKGTTSALGHVTLSDSTSTSAYVDGVAATPKAVGDALKAAKSYADGILAANDAMVFKGTLGTGGTVTSLPVKGYSAGWTYRVVTAGTYAGVVCEIGDLIIAVVNSNGTETTVTNAHWTVAQTNIDGAVTADANLSASQLLIGKGGVKGIQTLAPGSNGQVLKINASGVPAWASDINTDTWRQITVGGTALLGTATNTGALNFAAASGSGITVSGASGTVTIGSSFGALGIFNGSDANALGSYSPTSALSLAFGGGLQAGITGDKINVSHINKITAQTTNKLGSITYDANGHITGFTEVTSLKNPYAVSFGVGSSLTSYDGSGAVSFKIAAGTTSGTGSSDFSLSASHTGGVVTITPTYTKKYRSVGFYASNTTGTVTSAHADTNFDQLKLKPGNANVTLGWDATAKAMTISTIDTNTWRKVTACKLGSTTAGQMLSTSIGTDDLEFSSDFAWSGDNSASAKLHMVWTEVAEDGTITYAV
ncbi:MAG: hypothetical protein ACRCS6_08880 [Turicibacter sp.]